MGSELHIAVLKYDTDFTKRSKDIKKNSWFSFPNDLLLHPDFVEISGEELKWFIWIVSVCSKINNSKIRLNISHGVRILNISENSLFSMIEKLKGKQIDVVPDQMATAEKPPDDQSTASTLHYITIHNTTLDLNNNLNLAPLEKSSDSKTISKKSDSIKKLIKINSPNELSAVLENNQKHYLGELYPDAEFIRREFYKIQNWLDSNPKKNNKSSKGWATFVSNWLDNSWPKYQKGLPSNKVGGKTSVDEIMSIMGWKNE